VPTPQGVGCFYSLSCQEGRQYRSIERLDELGCSGDVVGVYPTCRAALETELTLEIAEHFLHRGRNDLERLACKVLADRAHQHSFLQEAAPGGTFDQHEAVFLLLKYLPMAHVEILTEKVLYFARAKVPSFPSNLNLELPHQVERRLRVEVPPL
jgi:hypothetical protein